MKIIFQSAVILSFFLFCDKMPLDPIETNPADSDSTTLCAITFAKNYGGDGRQYAKAIVKTTDGGYALVGTFSTPGTSDCIYLIKTDCYGNLLWQKTYQNPGWFSIGRKLCQTPDGGFILAGDEGQFNTDSRGFKLIKTDENGNLQWQQRYDSIYGADIALSHDMGYVGTGRYPIGPSFYQNKTLIFKVNSTGTLLWTKTIVKTVYAQGFSIERTYDNGFVIAGESLDSSNNADMYLLKINAQGAVQFQKTWGGPYWDRGYHTIQTRDGGYAIVGYNSKSDTSSTAQIYLVRVAPQGKTKWIKGYFPSTVSAGNQLQETSDCGFAIVGMTYIKPTLLKVRSTGSYQWQKTFSIDIIDEPVDFVVANDGGYALTGTVYIDGDAQAALVKTDKNGNF